MATWQVEGSVVRVETSALQAAVQTERYVSGVMAGSFVDRRTGARDAGFGLAIVDFLLEPGPDNDDTPPELRYRWGDLYHGQIPKRYVALPQICTQARKLPFEVVQGADFVAVRQWFTWTVARPPYRPGSRWEQWLVFPDSERWFLVYDRVRSANDVDCPILRVDMPGHLRHQRGDTFRRIYLSYVGVLASSEFEDDFPPDARYLYRRPHGLPPDRFIRAYELPNGVWLAGMTLDASIVYEAWCHQRGYVCFIQEVGGHQVAAGGEFGAVHLIGYFDGIAEMEQTFDAHRGARALHVDARGWTLRP
jgi:hypothetical protein